MNITTKDLSCDYYIKNGKIIDGSGLPGYHADVYIKDGIIAGVGRFDTYSAVKTIDASEKIITPGFIDCHSHTDSTITLNPEAESSIYQGITTEIVGNCGNSEALTIMKDLKETSINMAWLAGHNSIRFLAGVTGELASNEQLIKMRGLLYEAFKTGVIGFSTGLEFEPGRLCKTEEISYLLNTVKEYEGIYVSHIRNRAAQVFEAVDEFIGLIENSKVRGQISHMNIRYNTGAPPDAFEGCVKRIQEARSNGLEILADMTPLNYGIGQAAGILPDWFMKLDREDIIEFLNNKDNRNKLREDTDRYWRFIYNGEWERVRVQSCAALPEINGKEFLELSVLWGKSPWDCYCDIIKITAEKNENINAIVFVARLFTDGHLKETISHPLYCLAVDGYSTTIREPLASTTAFPLHYMGMAHFITHHVKTTNTLSLEEAIRKMTSMSAEHFGLKKRGLLKEGYFADITVFDYDKLKTPSTFEKPAVYTEGVWYVFVNGVPVLVNGVHTGVKPGRMLK